MWYGEVLRWGPFFSGSQKSRDPILKLLKLLFRQCFKVFINKSNIHLYINLYHLYSLETPDTGYIKVNSLWDHGFIHLHLIPRFTWNRQPLETSH